jgi:predicted nuclease with RNAse H fold
MHILGIDLSGPRNVADTYAALFREHESALYFLHYLPAAGDRQILDSVSDLGQSGPVIIGIDAPLSYNPGGGDRASDTVLRHLVRDRGGGVGIMPPTMIRMVYLTLRGIAVTRMLETLKPRVDLSIVEVHPGAAMLLRNASRQDLATLKRNRLARFHLLDWLETKGLNEIPRSDEAPDHFVMACAAALAAWDWAHGKPTWRFPAHPPAHPYDFAC